MALDIEFSTEFGTTQNLSNTDKHKLGFLVAVILGWIKVGYFKQTRATAANQFSLSNEIDWTAHLL